MSTFSFVDEMKEMSLADDLEYYVRFENNEMPRLKFSNFKEMTKYTGRVAERAICLLNQRMEIDRSKDYESHCTEIEIEIQMYTQIIHSVISILKALCSNQTILKAVCFNDAVNRNSFLLQLHIQHRHLRDVSERIDKYAESFKLKRWLYLALLLLLLLPTLILIIFTFKDEYATFSFLFITTTIVFAFLVMLVMNLWKILLDLHEIQKTISWTEKAIEFIPSIFKSAMSTEFHERYEETGEKENKRRPCCAFKLQEAVDKEKKREQAAKAYERACHALKTNNFLAAYRAWTQVFESYHN